MTILLNYDIFVDGSGDFFPDVLEQEHIDVVPMEVSVGESTFTYNPKEGKEDLIPFYDALQEGSMPTTSQVNAFHFEEIFSPVLEGGRDILYLCLDSALSGMYDQACVAARNLKTAYPQRQVEVVDTLCATGGIGCLLQYAVKNRKNGMSLSENADDLREIRHNIQHLFVVEDLYHLKRGGRLSATSAFVANALNIKPVLYVDPEGRLIPIAKARGMKQALKDMAKRYLNDVNRDFPEEVMICHGNSPKMAAFLKDLLEEKGGLSNIHVTLVSPVIGSHTGQGLVTLLFRGSRNH